MTTDRKTTEDKSEDAEADELYGSDLDDVLGGTGRSTTISGFTKGDLGFTGVGNDTLEFSAPTNDKPLSRRSK